MRALRALTENVPKPTNDTPPPPASVRVTLSSTASTALVASARDNPAAAATDSISSPLFMHSPLQIDIQIYKCGMPKTVPASPFTFKIEERLLPFFNGEYLRNSPTPRQP
jgi:hypothetical protein